MQTIYRCSTCQFETMSKQAADKHVCPATDQKDKKRPEGVFRLWSKKSNKYLKSCYHEYSITENGTLLDLDSTFYESGTTIRRKDKDSVDIEYCTGMRTRHGKLIYAGDRVRGPICGNEENIHDGVVTWSSTTLSWMVQPGDFFLAAFADIEITGNVHDKEK